MHKPNTPKLQQTSRRLNESAIRLNQIDAEITRLSKQLDYLKRIRSQYAAQADAEPVTDIRTNQSVA